MMHSEAREAPLRNENKKRKSIWPGAKNLATGKIGIFSMKCKKSANMEVKVQIS